MSPYDSMESVASRLESRIACSESNNQILVIQAEGRLNARIHELEMKLIRRGVFALPEIDTLLKWIGAVYVAFILFCVLSMLGGHNSSHVQPVSQESAAETPAPQAASHQDKSE